MAITDHNRISIAVVVIYTPFLLGGIYLSIRHGFGRNAGWLYLILFSLIRLIGAALDLATINQPTNIGLYVGSATLQNVGVSALILVLLGLIGRALASIQKTTRTVITPQHLRLVQTLVLVGLILGIVGGSKSSSSFQQTGTLQSNSESTAGLGVIIAGYAILCASTILIATQVNYAEAGERRLIAAVGLSLPFVLVRLIYSCIGTFGNDKNFKPITGNVWIQLGMAVIMEMIVVLICEAVGFTLKKIPKATRTAAPAYQMQDTGRDGHNPHKHHPQDNGRV
jgi:hypothetical protein